jgi:cysteinyl-tRNA synthetase
MVVRFFMMQAHYRSVLDFSSDALNAAEKGYQRLMNAIKVLNNVLHVEKNLNESHNTAINYKCSMCYAHMNDDFNTPRTLSVLFELVNYINQFSNLDSFGNLTTETFYRLKDTMNSFVVLVLGLKVEEAQDSEKLDGVVQLLISMRNQAKADKNYDLSDQIRDQLADLGVKLKDGKEGTTYSLD